MAEEQIVDNGTPAPADNVTPTEETSWRDALPEGLRENNSLGKFSSVEALAKSYVNAEQLIGREKIPMPQSEEDWDTVYNRLGRPETADNYELTVPETLPEKIRELDGNIDWFRETAHQLGLNDKQAQGIYNAFWDNLAKDAEIMEADGRNSAAEAEAELRAEWGTKAEYNLEVANRFASEVGGDELIDLLQQVGLDTHPVVIKAFNKAGLMTIEDHGTPKGGDVGMTRNEVMLKRGELMANPAYLNKNDINHKAVVKEVYNLTKMLFPDEAA
jgi:hypothetical protein